MTDINDLIANAQNAEAALEAELAKAGTIATGQIAQLATDQTPPVATPAPISEGKPEIDFSVRKRQYIPATGVQISTFLRAVERGMKDAHYASEAEVVAFAGKA